MKLFDVLKTVGGGVLRVAGYGGVIDAVNAILPSDKKLPADSTGNDIQAAVDELPPDQRAAILDKKFDVELAEIKAHSENLEVMAEVDKTGNSTRPLCALIAMWLLVFESVVLVSMIGWAIGSNAAESLKNIKDFWPIFVVLLGFPAGIVTSYFGKRTKEKQSRYNMAAGQVPAMGMISGIVKAFKG